MPIPCKDCVTLAVCKSQFKVSQLYNSVHDLYFKCSILRDHLNNPTPVIYQSDLNPIREFFKDKGVV